MAIEGFQAVAKVEEVPPGQSKLVTLNNRTIALFNVDGKVYAIHNLCPHEGGPLNEGRVKGFVVGCPRPPQAVDLRKRPGTPGGGGC